MRETTHNMEAEEQGTRTENEEATAPGEEEEERHMNREKKY